MSTMRRRSGARQRRWSKAEYYRLGELGFFRGQRVELIEGAIIVQSPQDLPPPVPFEATQEDLRYHPVRLRRWTKDEYYRLGEVGFFRGQRVELIEGYLMV